MDLLRINHCFRFSENCFKINADIKTDETQIPGTMNINYEIECNIPDDCNNYVTALNHVSQLMKCKIFSYKTINNENSNSNNIMGNNNNIMGNNSNNIMGNNNNIMGNNSNNIMGNNNNNIMGNNSNNIMSSIGVKKIKNKK